ncbi:MAG: DUF1554 domain-containing protein [Leptospiraceae bacterium]|nr:DUF1554 domain-containing protein [Leptospiraceae bacterium]
MILNKYRFLQLSFIISLFSYCSSPKGAQFKGVLSLVGDIVGNSSTYTVGGSVSGLSGTLVIINNGGDSLSLNSDGNFTFPTALNDLSTYEVSISSQPTGQFCTLSNGSGTIASANVSNISISCSNFTITYSASAYTYSLNTAISTLTPTVTGTVTSCTSSPALPTGLSIDSACVISGTPTATQVASSYTITATDSVGNTASAGLSITINADPPSALTYTGSPFTFTQNTAISTQTPTKTGTVTSCTSNPTLPNGLSIDATTCAISGTPTTAQAATTYTITASNTYGSTTASISITVNGITAPSALTYTGSPYTFLQNASISSQTPTVTGTVTSCTSSPTLPAGLSIDASTCAISGTPSTVQAAITYTITASNAGGSTTASISITVNSFSYTGSTFVFKAGTAINSLSPTGVGTITACSSTPTLPAGLNLSSSCVITGTPGSAQTATNYTITATISGGTPNTTISIKVASTLYRVFVTSTTYTGDLKTQGGAGDGPAGADNLCNADANKPSTGTYKAILFASGIREANPTPNNWVLYASSTYVRASDSAHIFDTNTSRIFTFGNLTSPFDSGSQKEYWTGFRGAGWEWELGLYTCVNWTSSSSFVTGRFGQSDATNYDSISTGITNTRNQQKHLLCAEQ